MTIQCNTKQYNLTYYNIRIINLSGDFSKVIQHRSLETKRSCFLTSLFPSSKYSTNRLSLNSIIDKFKNITYFEHFYVRSTNNLSEYRFKI